MMALQTDFVPTSTTLPVSITAPPTIQFTPPPECYDPANNWIVSEKCWLDLGAGTTSPDWLTCSHTRFGPPAGQQSLCDVPRSADFRMAPKTTQDGVVSYYSGCPVGLSENATLVQRGWNVRSYGGNLGDYDATGTIIVCCPTQYQFAVDYSGVVDEWRTTSTSHDGVDYSVLLDPTLLCTATSISELSGKEIVIKTESDSMAGHKRQLQTVPWHYELDTMFAYAPVYTYTVFQSTHTCYESCDGWFTYYYPGAVSGAATRTPQEIPGTDAPGETSTVIDDEPLPSSAPPGSPSPSSAATRSLTPPVVVAGSLYPSLIVALILGSAMAVLP